MTTSRQPKKRTGKASSPRSGWEIQFEMEADRHRKLQARLLECLKRTVELCEALGFGISSFPGSASPATARGGSELDAETWEDKTAREIRAPDSSEKALGTCDGASYPHPRGTECPGWCAAAAPPAAREQGGGGKPQKRTKRRLVECNHHGIKGAICCDKCNPLNLPVPRGAPQSKRSPRSR